jgi:hypothetical protein
MINTMRTCLFASAALLALGAGANAQQANMSFFVTSVGSGNGANLGGIAGADKHCQDLAAAAGAGSKTWHAYLSTQGDGAVNARDRIGAGPWYNQKGVMIAMNVDDLHGDVKRDRNYIYKLSALDEKGSVIMGVGDAMVQHDMLTGTDSDGKAFPAGMDMTCSNWTNDTAQGRAMLGHTDRQGLPTGGNTSWNEAHLSAGCDAASLVRTGGNGRFYCFAIN